MDFESLTDAMIETGTRAKNADIEAKDAAAKSALAASVAGESLKAFNEAKAALKKAVEEYDPFS